MRKGAILCGMLALIPWNRGMAATNFGQASDIFNVGAGARSMAMGSAYTALSDDASAPYYNPAGMAYIDEHQIMAMYAPLYMDSGYNYLSTVDPFGDKWGTLGFSNAQLASTGFELRDVSNNLTESNGSFVNDALFLSYAHKLVPNLSAGVNTKFIQQKAAGYSSGALGVDAGFIYYPLPLLSLGLVFDNLNAPKIQLHEESDAIRPVTKLGVAATVLKNRLTFTADIIKPSKESTQFAAGLELNVHKMINLRGGLNANRNPTFGVGLKLKTFSIDYAFSSTDLGAFNKVSLTWAWHNIYTTSLAPPEKDGQAVYPLSGFENAVVFTPTVPHQTVAHWSLTMTNQEGKAVRTLRGDLAPPEKIVWDAKNDVGEPVSDGDYTTAFLVEYKNGKTWLVPGKIKLSLPTPILFGNDLDMKLNLNGENSNDIQPEK